MTIKCRDISEMDEAHCSVSILFKSASDPSNKVLVWITEKAGLLKTEMHPEDEEEAKKKKTMKFRTSQRRGSDGKVSNHKTIITECRDYL